MSAVPRGDRWMHLVESASDIEAAPPPEVERVLRARLGSILEVFPAGLDPVTDLEGAAVRRLALSLASALARLRNGGA